MYANKFSQPAISTPIKTVIDEQINFDASRINNVTQSQFIECIALYNMFSMESDYLIMDCRPAYDYEQSRIQCNNIINIPEEIIRKG